MVLLLFFLKNTNSATNYDRTAKQPLHQSLPAMFNMASETYTVCTMHTTTERGPHIDADDKSTASLGSSGVPIDRCRPYSLISAVFISCLLSGAPSTLSLFLFLFLSISISAAYCMRLQPFSCLVLYMGRLV